MKAKIQLNSANLSDPLPAPSPVAGPFPFFSQTLKPQRSKLMQKLIALFMVVGLWVAAPLLQAQSIETDTFTTNRLVPDGNAAGLSDVRTLNSAIGNITGLSVGFKLTGEYNGDLYVYLRHASGYTVLLNRPGKTVANPAGYPDSGFNVTFQDSAANGDVHLYQNITTPTAGSPLTGAWQPDGRTNDPTTVTDASTRATTLSNFNGLNAAGEWTLYVSDLQSGGTNLVTEWSLQITGAATPTLTWTNPANITYGTPLSSTQLNAVAVYNATNVTGSYVYTPASGTVLNAGNSQTLAVTFTPADTTSFLSVSTNVTINVLTAPLSITANNTNKVYGASLPAFTASYSGFVNGDSAVNLTTPVSLTSSATSASPVGRYAINASGATSTNYNITQVGGFLTNTPAALSISANNTNMVYGATVPAFTASYSGLVNGDSPASLTTPVSLTSSATPASPAGSYTITATGAADANYNIGYVNGTLTIGSATLTVTANHQTKAYGAALPTLTASYAGFVNGDTTNSLTALATLATTATSTSDVGNYPITVTNAVSSNYAFIYVTNTLTVTNAWTTGALVSSANPALPGAAVTFTQTITPVAPGAGAPTGPVNFRIDGSIAGSGTLFGGVATYTTSTLSHATHTVVAEYAGSTDFVGVTNTLSPVQTINTPPVAGNETVYRALTVGVKFRLADLLAHASDADGDTLTIVISPSSANGGTITTNFGWVFYTPASGYTNADSFTYTVADGYGGAATGTVTVDILVDDAAGQNLVITPLGGASYQIEGSGIPGRTYHLQYNDSLISTPTNWFDLSGGSVTADGTGAFQFTDPAGNSGRAYRSVYP
jgi:subtilisin-like proprotein convertase family protein